MKLHTIFQNHRGSWKYHRRFGKYDGIFVGMEFSQNMVCFCFKGKEKYRGIFEIQKSGDKTSSGEIGLDIRTHASPKVGHDQVSGGAIVQKRLFKKKDKKKSFFQTMSQI